MAQSYGPKPINVDGLVFCMDAGNPASFTSGSSIANNVAPYALSTQTGSLINSAQYNPDGGGCWEFDGTDDRIDCDTMRNILSPTAASGSGASSINLQNYTIEIWIKADSTAASYDIAVGSKDTNFHQGGYALLLHTSVGYYGDGDWGAGPRRYPQTNTAATRASWQNVVLTYDGSNAYIYSNGNIGTGVGTQTGDMKAASEQFCIGGTQQPTWTEWDGWIASVKIYKKALSSTEILDNYKNQLPRFE